MPLLHRAAVLFGTSAVITALSCTAAPDTSNEQTGAVSAAVTMNQPPPGWRAPAPGDWWYPKAGLYNPWAVSPYCEGAYQYADNQAPGCGQWGSRYKYGWCHDDAAASPSPQGIVGYQQGHNLDCVCCPDWMENTYTNILAYRVLSVAYAPPGNASSVSYSSGSLTGSQVSIQNTSQVGGAIQLTSSAMTTSASWVSGVVDGTTNQVTLQTNSGFGVNNSTNSGDTINHGNDLIEIWTVPQLITTVNATTGVQKSVLTDSANSKVVSVFLSELEDPSQMSPGLKAILGGLTPADFEAIASVDPWHANRSFDPNTWTSRFALQASNQSIVLESPQTPTEPIPTYNISLNTSDQDTYIRGTQENVQLQALYGAKVSFILDGGIQGGVQMNFQYQKLHGTMTGSQFAANAVLASSTQCYTQVVSAWVDEMFNSYAFVAGAAAMGCAANQSDVYQLALKGVPVIAGNVRTATGIPVGGAEVTATFATNPPQKMRGVTRPDGTFAFVAGVPFAPVTIASPGGKSRLTAVPGTTCTPHQCGTQTTANGFLDCGGCCTPTAHCGGGCGPIPDGCGGMLDCGSCCPTGTHPDATGKCVDNACSDVACAMACKQCNGKGGTCSNAGLCACLSNAPCM